MDENTTNNSENTQTSELIQQQSELPTEQKQKKNGFKFNLDFFKQLFFKIRHFDIKKCRIQMEEAIISLQKNAKTMIFSFLAAFILMIAIAVCAFFSVVQGAEKVMVPNVVEKPLAEALLEMQSKELYPKIQLRYSEVPGDAGKILEQSPAAGAIVKAGRRISLVVSRGIIIDHVEDYVGQILDDVRIELQTLFAGSTNPLIVLADPVYKADVSNPGTILEQTPPSGTIITEPVTVTLVVSRGPEFENTRVPKIVGKSLEEMLNMMKTSKVSFDFSSHIAQDNEKPGTIVSQQTVDSEFIPNYSHFSAQFAFPQNDSTIYGIFTDTLTNYPYPVPMKLEVIPPEGEIYTLIDFVHAGGLVTIPYAVPRDSILIFSVVGRERKRVEIK